MAVCVADSQLFVALWDWDHPSGRAARAFMAREVQSGNVRLHALDLIWFELLDGVAASMARVDVHPDIVLALYSDMAISFADLQRDGRLTLAPAEPSDARAAFVASVAWHVSFAIAATAYLARTLEVPILAVAGERHEAYARIAANVSGLEVRLLQ